MMGRDLGMGQHQLVICIPSNSNLRIAQFERTHRRRSLLLCATSIIIGEGDKRTVFIADTEEVSTRQGFMERFISSNFATLVEKPIEGLLTSWVRMDEEKLISLAHNL